MRVGTTRYLLVSEEHVFQGIGSGHVELDKRFHHERPVRSGRGVDPPGVRPGRDGKSPTEAGVEGASSGRAPPGRFELLLPRTVGESLGRHRGGGGRMSIEGEVGAPGPLCTLALAAPAVPAPASRAASIPAMPAVWPSPLR